MQQVADADGSGLVSAVRLGESCSTLLLVATSPFPAVFLWVWQLGFTEPSVCGPRAGHVQGEQGV